MLNERKLLEDLIHQKLIIKNDQNIRSQTFFQYLKSQWVKISPRFRRNQPNQMKTTQHTKAREAAGMSYAISLSGVRERGGEKAGEHTAVKALACPSQRAR